uniref:ADAMTS-like protein 1 n=1 Tax=Monopterus albus TaxID=43700 RepID=A0A3Q3QJF0_MONAL
MVVGGYAYLLPWTTVVLRCPTRHFRKGHIQWLKEGKPLVSLPHLSLTSFGYVKIQQVRASDAGIYTCIAGPAREHFILQVIGSKQKLSGPESWLFAGRQQNTGQPDLTSAGEGFQELPIPLNQYDNIVQHLLELRGSVQPHSSDKNRSPLEGERASAELSNPVMLIVDTHRLDEIMRNLSEGEHLIAQLLSELTMAQGETNESTLHPLESAESSIQGLNIRPRNPVIIQQPRRVRVEPLSEMVVQVGVPVLLQKPVATLELRCEALENPELSLTWTKNGKPLHYNSRIGLLPNGALRIQAPSKVDEGLYTCAVRNHLGSASLSSWLQITGGRCNSMVANGPVCPERTNSSQSAELCHGQGCPLRWLVDPWSPCSATCGGGSQTRSVRCMKGPVGRAREVESRHCLDTGRRPSKTRLCNLLPCSQWATTSWGPCHGQCVGPSLATQHRHVYCQDTNGTKVPYRKCSGLPRPRSLKNCSTEACALYWRVGPWTQCTTTCGRHGFQSRQVTCVHQRTGRATHEHQCRWRPRPPSWQRCNFLSCGRAGECRDSTRYCEKVRQLELCPLPQFKSRCCHSCRNT